MPRDGNVRSRQGSPRAPHPGPSSRPREPRSLPLGGPARTARLPWTEFISTERRHGIRAHFANRARPRFDGKTVDSPRDIATANRIFRVPRSVEEPAGINLRSRARPSLRARSCCRRRISSKSSTSTRPGGSHRAGCGDCGPFQRGLAKNSPAGRIGLMKFRVLLRCRSSWIRPRQARNERTSKKRAVFSNLTWSRSTTPTPRSGSTSATPTENNLLRKPCMR